MVAHVVKHHGSFAVVAALISILLAGLYFAVLPHYGFPSEDAAILYSYSENLANTGVIAYYRGAAPAEGATDFLWMVLLAVLFKGGLPVYAGALFLSAASLLGSAWLLGKIAGQSHPAFFWFSALLLLLLPPVFAAVQGFSPLFFGFFILLCFYSAREGRLALLFVSALVVSLIRPDGVVFAGPLVLVALWCRRAEFRRWTGPALALLVLPGLAYFVWRMYYFGHLMPLPFYVKSNFERTALLFHGDSLLTNLKFAGAAIPLLLFGWWQARSEREADRPRWAVCALAVFGVPLLFYSVMKLEQNIAYRFQYPLALMAIALAVTTVRIQFRPAALMISGALMAVILSPLYAFEFMRVAETPQENIPYISQEMKSIQPAGTLAVSEAGRLPYYSGWPAIDLWGLNTPALAKEIVQPSFIRETRPDVIVLHADGDDYGFLGQEPPPPARARSWQNMTLNVYAGIDPSAHLFLMVPHKRESNGAGPFIHLADWLVARLGYRTRFPVYYLFAIRNDYAGREPLQQILAARGAITVDEYQRLKQEFSAMPD